MTVYHLFGLYSISFFLYNVILHILNSFCVFALISRLSACVITPRLLDVGECELKAVALRRIPPLKRQVRITPKHAQKISEKFSSGDARGQLEKDHELARGASWNNPSTALAVCLLFAIHPVHWEAVSNISGRSILLNALYVLMSFCLFIDFYKSRRIGFLFGSLAGFVLALLCKESAAILPVVLILYLLLFAGEGKKPWFAVVPYFLIVFGFILLRQQLGITQLFSWGSPDALALGFLTFVRGVITYLRLFIFPVDLYFDRSLKVFGSFMDLQLTLALLFWIAAALTLWFNRKKVGGPLLFLLIWFLIELAPVSQIVTSIGVQPGFISLAEHFLYVPSVAALTLLVLGVQYLWNLNIQRNFCSRPIAIAGIMGFLVFLYLTTIQQTVYAGNELAMLKRSVAMQPYNSRVQYSLGMNYVYRGMFQAAEGHFRQAVAMDPWNVRARIALGKSLCDQGRYHEGLTVYRSIGDAGKFTEILLENIRLSQAIIDGKNK